MICLKYLWCPQHAHGGKCRSHTEKSIPHFLVCCNLHVFVFMRPVYTFFSLGCTYTVFSVTTHPEVSFNKGEKSNRTTRTTQQPPLLPEEVRTITPKDILGRSGMDKAMNMWHECKAGQHGKSKHHICTPEDMGMGTLCTTKKSPIYEHGDDLHCQKAPHIWQLLENNVVQMFGMLPESSRQFTPTTRYVPHMRWSPEDNMELEITFEKM